MDDLQEILKQIPQKKTLQEKDIIYGKVVLVKEKFAILEILKTQENRVITSDSAMLFISAISKDYVESINDCVANGDIVKAKVESIDKFGVKVRTDQDDLGVMFSKCKNCKSTLDPTQFRTKEGVKCLNCKNIEKRKFIKE